MAKAIEIQIQDLIASSNPQLLHLVRFCFCFKYFVRYSQLQQASAVLKLVVRSQARPAISQQVSLSQH